MTKRKKLILLTLLMVFSFSLLPLASVKADEQTTVAPEKIMGVESHCDTIKQSLKRIQNSDRNTRVSIGSSFQTILNSFITPLNVRLLKNNAFDYNLNNIQNSFVETRSDFIQAYITYSQELENLLNIDCSKEPETFYKKLEEVRKKRSEVAKATEKVKSVIDKHISAVKALRDKPEANND